MKILVYKPAEKFQIFKEEMDTGTKNNIYFAVTKKDLFVLAKSIQPDAILIGESCLDKIFYKEISEKLPDEKILYINKETVLSEINLKKQNEILKEDKCL
ncbi:MAG: hypothetical protein K9N09_08785 [Candidatus Cloacimonetes bacterium]|nr:hypothetical protein [Candidatus Cloacimonadota bacterium]MCF7868781.1 hypothetical protein [Candidatus Cloacimonadota bacterium]MCF7884211.1 hypothetical protein [Candidatus Cloacimonadota bacterium]